MKERIIFHVDVNSAYLSWEAVYRLQHGDTVDLREIPSVVGGDPKSRRGIVLAKSIPAKKFGIITGETLYSALQKCPNLTIVPPSYELYIKCSNAMMDILKKYSPKVQRFSVDECFLDYSNMDNFGPPLKTAEKIKEHIHRELGFTVNIGISSNKLLAKMASDLSKPNKVHTLFPEEIPKKLWPLPVENLFMVGRATAPKLHKLGIFTIGDLAKSDKNLIKYKLKSHGELIWNYANGIEISDVATIRPDPKGLGNSTTIPFDVEDKITAHMVLLSLTEMVSMRLRDHHFLCGLVSISIKTSDFKSCSHQRKLFTPTDSTNRIYEVAKNLFDEIWTGEKIRHLGVRVSEFSPSKFYQASIFDNMDSIEKNKSLDRSIDKIRLKYGTKSIIRGCFLNTNIKPVNGGVGPDDYPFMTSIL